MADDSARQRPPENGSFVAQASAVFARDLFQPMFKRAAVAPGDVRRLIAEFREKLDALDVVLSAMPDPGAGNAPSLPMKPSLMAMLEGAGLAGDAAATGGGEAAENDEGDGFEDIGRNQRSRLREITLLEFLSRENRAYALQQVLTALAAKGFDDTSGAVVSQLHRLKKLGVIHQPAGGMYEITDQGLSHLRKLRSSFGALMGGEGRT